MSAIDRMLDSQPTDDLVEELAELRIRNLLCFEELESFNNTGRFVCKHPLVQQYSMHSILTDLLRNDPNKFLKEYRNTANNVSRYQSYLNTKPASEKNKEKWEVQLKKHQDRAFVMTEILEKNGK